MRCVSVHTSIATRKRPCVLTFNSHSVCEDIKNTSYMLGRSLTSQRLRVAVSDNRLRRQSSTTCHATRAVRVPRSLTLSPTLCSMGEIKAKSKERGQQREERFGWLTRHGVKSENIHLAPPCPDRARGTESYGRLFLIPAPLSPRRRRRDQRRAPPHPARRDVSRPRSSGLVPRHAGAPFWVGRKDDARVEKTATSWPGIEASTCLRASSAGMANGSGR